MKFRLNKEIQANNYTSISEKDVFLFFRNEGVIKNWDNFLQLIKMQDRIFLTEIAVLFFSLKSFDIFV